MKTLFAVFLFKEVYRWWQFSPVYCAQHIGWALYGLLRNPRRCWNNIKRKTSLQNKLTQIVQTPLGELTLSHPVGTSWDRRLSKRLAGRPSAYPSVDPITVHKGVVIHGNGRIYALKQQYPPHTLVEVVEILYDQEEYT